MTEPPATDRARFFTAIDELQARNRDADPGTDDVCGDGRTGRIRWRASDPAAEHRTDLHSRRQHDADRWLGDGIGDVDH